MRRDEMKPKEARPLFYKKTCQDKTTICDGPDDEKQLEAYLLYGRQGYCCPPGDPRFPRWHRLFMSSFEDKAFELLRMEYPAFHFDFRELGWPYWDWTSQTVPAFLDFAHLCVEKAALPRDFAWKDRICNVSANATHCCFTNWWAGSRSLVLQQSLGIERSCRNVDYPLFDAKAGRPDTYDSFFQQILIALSYKDYTRFEAQFEVPHNTIHVAFGIRNTRTTNGTLLYPYLRETDCACCVMPTRLSPADPAFWLHQSQVDRLLAAKDVLDSISSQGLNMQDRALQLQLGCTAQLLTRPLAPFHDPILNPVPLTLLVAQVPAEVIEMHALRYQYDSLALGGRNVSEWAALIGASRAGSTATSYIGVRWCSYLTANTDKIIVSTRSGIKVGVLDVLPGNQYQQRAFWDLPTWILPLDPDFDVLSEPLVAHGINSKLDSFLSLPGPTPLMRLQNQTERLIENQVCIPWKSGTLLIPENDVYGPIIFFGDEGIYLQQWDACDSEAGEGDDTYWSPSMPAAAPLCDVSTDG
eukprot:g17989.t1